MLQTYYVINLLFEPIFVMPAHLQLITEYVHFEPQQNLIFLLYDSTTLKIGEYKISRIGVASMEIKNAFMSQVEMRST